MPHAFHRKRGVAPSIRKIALGEIDKALAAISDTEADEAEIIHTVRQQLKCLRALIRLARGHFDAYGEENEAFRDIARTLSRTRDADVLRDTFEQLVADTNIKVPAPLRRRLLGNTSAAAAQESRRRLLEGEISAGLLAARRRVKRWRFERKGFPLLSGGLKRVYADMREDEALAAEHPTAATFHEWRKQTKYHANQLRLFEPVAPDVIKGYRKLADRLGSILGDHHDLDGLAAAVASVAASPGAAPLVEAIRSRNAELEAEAFRLGHELAAERPGDFLRRIETGWKAWRQ